MSIRKKLPIISSVLVGLLLVTIFIKRGENVHNFIPNSDNNSVLKNDLFEKRDIENHPQSINDLQVIKKTGHLKENNIQDSSETDSLVNWVNQIDNLASDRILDTNSKIKKIIGWLNEDNTPNEIRVKLYRVFVQLKPIGHIDEIFSLIEKENNPDIKLAGMEALALTGKQLISLGYAEGQLIINLLKSIEQQTPEAAISKKVNSLVAYMENVLAGNENKVVKIEYLTGRDNYIWDLSAKLEDKENLKNGLARLLNDVSVLVDQDKALLNEEYNKLNLAYLDYFSNGLSGSVPGHQDVGSFFEKIKPQKIEIFTEDAVSRYRIWLTAYSYSSERGSNDYDNFIMNELKATDSPVAALVLVENGLNIVDQLDPLTREKLVSLLEDDSLVGLERLSDEAAEALRFLMQ